MARTDGAAPGVTIESFDGEAAVVLRAGETAFAVLPEVGLVGASLTHRGSEYLDFAGADRVRAGHTTGMPLLAPWANRLSSDRYRSGSTKVDLAGQDLHRDASGLPIHGLLVGRRGWEVLSVRTRSGEASLAARFDASADAELMEAFPFEHEIGVAFAVTGGRLTVTTSIEATGRRAVPVSFGWHPYFRLPDAARDRLRLVLPERTRLVTDERGIPDGGEVSDRPGTVKLASRSFDDGFRLGGVRQFVLAAGRRRASVVFDRNYPFAQVYSPEGADFVAIEPMTAAVDALVQSTTPLVQPGSRFTARFAVSLT